MEPERRTSTGGITSRECLSALLLVCLVVLVGCGAIGGAKDVPPSPAVLLKPSEVGQAAAALEASAVPDPVAPQASAEAPQADPEPVAGPQFARLWFDPEDCACAGLPGTAEPRYGPGYLECTYRWGGTHIDDDLWTFKIEQYEDLARLQEDFNDHIGWSYDAAQTDKNFIDTGSRSGSEQYILRNNAESGFTYVTTAPGGGGSKTGGEIPMCGNGSGVLLVENELLVELRLFACDLGDERLAYENAIQALETCALASIEQARRRNP